MNRRTDSSSWKILSTSNESSGRRIPIEMESLCTSMPRWTNERCERLDTGRLLSAWGSFCLRVDDPRQHRQRSRPFHDDFARSPETYVCRVQEYPRPPGSLRRFQESLAPGTAVPPGDVASGHRLGALPARALIRA